jgi:ArsR family transcriptional regulator, arsenate/arsenite/antimonite-responsive transcriptional repressor
MVKHVDTTLCSSTNQTISELLEMLRAFSDETRQKIIRQCFSEKEICVNDIARQFTLSRPTISHHLNLMKRAKLLNSRKVGKEVYYSVNKEHIISFLESFLNTIRKCC